MTLTIEIKGVEEARRAIRINVPKQLERAIDAILPQLARLAAGDTPVVTGSMRRAWTGTRKGMLGRLHIDPAAVNTRSGIPVTAYAGGVSDRLGILQQVHARAGRIAEKALKKEVGFGGNKP